MKKYGERISARIIVAVLVIIMACSVLVGCNFGSSIRFSVSSLSLVVGEQVDVSVVVEASGEYTLSSDTTAISVRGKTVIGAKAGRGYLTATLSGGASAYIRVTVSYCENSEFTISSEGELSQTVGHMTPVTFTVNTNDGCDPKYKTAAVWTVNDEAVGTGENFTFTPTAVGDYTVKASATVGEDTKTATATTVRVHNPVESVLTCTTPETLNQDGELAIVRFSVSISDSSTDNSIQWFVNDELKGNENDFSYRPTGSGRYVITCKVNGVLVELENGETSVTVTVVNVVTAEITAVTVDFDNDYPNVFVTWEQTDSCDAYTVDIAFGGTTTTYSSLAPDMKSRFDGYSFDASTFIDVTADAPSTYTITVNPTNSSGMAMGVSAKTTFTQIDSKLKEYLEGRYFACYNRYIADIDEFGRLCEYLLTSNKNNANGVTSSHVRASVFIAYDWEADIRANVDSLQSYISKVIIPERMSISGGYMYIDAKPLSSIDNAYDIGLRPQIAEAYEQTGRAAESYLTINGRFHKPQINYAGVEDGYKDRAANFNTFAIDLIDYTQDVETSSQLDYAVQNGARPVCKSGSDAEKLYKYARNVLRQIISDDMNDFQKVTAINDWIMWRVRYDYYGVTDAIPNDKTSAYSMYYLESVLTDGEDPTISCTDANGDVYLPYSVCDGMSKAMQLMCNIEGIKATRLTGKAGDFGANNRYDPTDTDVGGHAWVTVKIDGEWYVCDPTWGDFSTQIKSGEVVEFASHAYMFLTSAQIGVSHYVSNLGAPIATEEYNIYENTFINYNNQTYNLEVDSDEITEMAQIYINYLKAIYDEKGSTSYIVMPGSAAGYVGDEFYNAFIEVHLDNATDSTTFTKALSDAAKEANVSDLLDTNMFSMAEIGGYVITFGLI